MKLAISNLAWGLTEQDSILPRLSSLGVSGIEVAPTKIANWESINSTLLANFRSHLRDNGLCVSSLQAIFFGKPEAQLLASADKFSVMCEHVDKLADIAAELGAEVAVFGAPKNRLRGELSDAVAFDIATERFKQLGEICSGRMKIGIEPVPAFYGADFILTAEEDLALVKAVNHPAIGLHLDTGCVFLAGGDIELVIHKGAEHLIHFHAAEPELSNFSFPKANHISAAIALKDIGYERWVSIEMKENEDSIKSVVDAVKFIRQVYFQKND
jgi:sugar phosphate isomerase/epimerase